MKLRKQFCTLKNSSFIIHPSSFKYLAERVGFEPTEPFQVHYISNVADSTALAPFLKIKNYELKIKNEILIF